MNGECRKKQDPYLAAFLPALESIRKIVSDRLIALDLKKIRLPLGASETEPHVPIFISSDLESKKRIIILFYEDGQDIGIFAHRIIGGKGGINEGSAINIVKYIQSLQINGHDAPGIIIANTGQLRWWRKGKKAITQVSWYALPQKSAVDFPYRFDEIKNTIPENRTVAEHVSYIFNHVVSKLADPAAKLDIIGVSAGAVHVSHFLNNELNFDQWGCRINAFASVATYFNADEITNARFGAFMRDRGRVYLVSDEPRDTFLAGLDGYRHISAYGSPVFSLGEPYYTERLLPRGYKSVVDWIQDVAEDPEYVNPEFARYDDGAEEAGAVPDWGNEAFENRKSSEKGKVFELGDKDGDEDEDEDD